MHIFLFCFFYDRAKPFYRLIVYTTIHGAFDCALPVSTRKYKRNHAKRIQIPYSEASTSARQMMSAFVSEVKSKQHPIVYLFYKKKYVTSHTVYVYIIIKFSIRFRICVAQGRIFVTRLCQHFIVFFFLAFEMFSRKLLLRVVRGSYKRHSANSILPSLCCSYIITRR